MLHRRLTWEEFSCCLVFAGGPAGQVTDVPVFLEGWGLPVPKATSSAEEARWVLFGPLRPQPTPQLMCNEDVGFVYVRFLGFRGCGQGSLTQKKILLPLAVHLEERLRVSQSVS